MSQYVGLDVPLKEVSVCVVDANGAVLSRASLPTDPDAIAAFVAAKAPDAERVVHESGILATWLTRNLPGLVGSPRCTSEVKLPTGSGLWLARASV
jgi:hypothetical protein